MIVTAHQPNFLPGVSVTSKCASSDAVIWLDAVQYTKGGWTNRNKLADGTRLHVPFDHRDTFAPINRVRIGKYPQWQRKLIRSLTQHLGSDAQPFVDEIEHPYRMMVGLNVALLRVLFDELEIATPWHFQSHLDSAHAVPSIGDEVRDLEPISVRLASMVQQVGGDVYLSGPSGKAYLDETPFHDLDIAVEYYKFEGPNPSAVAMLKW